MDYIHPNNWLLIDDNDNTENDTDLYNGNIIIQLKQNKKKELKIKK